MGYPQAYPGKLGKVFVNEWSWRQGIGRSAFALGGRSAADFIDRTG